MKKDTKKPKRKRPVIWATVPEYLEAWLRENQEKTGTTISWQVSKALENYYKENYGN